MKKNIDIMISFLQLILVGGIYLIQKYTNKKLGMNRWVVYHSMQFAKNTTLNIAIKILPFILIIIFIYLIKINIDYIKQHKMALFDFVILSILTIIIIFLSIFLNYKLLKIYYFVIFIMLIIYILQIIKMCITKYE